MTLFSENPLGDFLRARRLGLDPASFGFLPGRRRTPGLRREEVAQLANISPTWYTWLEQGRGGTPSREVLNRIAAGLRLTPPERDHLFILAFGHPPESRVSPSGSITPRLQRMLESLTIPAIIKTAIWDVVAWNYPAAVVLKDYALLPPARRNILRLLFTDPEALEMQHDREGVARLIVNAFRADAARLGASEEIARLVEELSAQSADFARLWRNNDVAGHGEGLKMLHHPQIGTIALEFCTFSVEGRPDLSMMLLNPATDESRMKIERWITQNLAQREG
ncbi:helix-turn-helix domain-containing protein [Cronobacter malonaticus]|uniref:helix-turn-helix transcriptional regulator n=1 Tax=Cronobacter malonaticus TaxID=413503 RepID=UPI000D00BD09|nr:helix-turn-helix transcriptional regulator [Cronobacter malonaticus]ELY2622096.1 helix-turn-helix domain-containing protein [Cronobacter malonaticus]ELY3623106.1 helix-turn-helix domain-containing protein [Cronobacter malonaticus]MBF4664211.1 helix-turn-helix domain-containing protein [Cronobacter malonaticus]MBF4837869.1 helix-turn-helix domain-containing protein [Cronobacter malonaticus]MBF4845582.1 helix-turn-helix domain-containing protein [Cronobacter malonaticus]